MGKLYPELDERLRKFIDRQSVFFVATAPSAAVGGAGAGGVGVNGGGHVNVSPKGYRDTFAVLGPRTVAYLDLTGSGVETIAHLRQNGRITIMFCSFDHSTKVVRLYGRGRVVVPGNQDWGELAVNFPRVASRDWKQRNERAIIVVDLDRIADSCGYGVPIMEPQEERDVLDKWAENKPAEQLATYRAEKNALSIDGLPGLDTKQADTPAPDHTAPSHTVG